MDNFLKKAGLFAVLLLNLTAMAAKAAVVPPAPEREFRGVWIASVFNIHWPSSRDMTTEQQKAELRDMLDRAAKMNMNAVVLQVRPSADALYASPYEPWSYFLTGTMGKAPKPYYDPLAFAVEEAHKRGLELHAWFNPYRARAGENIPLSANHIAKRNPSVVKTYGKMMWLDPGEKAAQDHSIRVMLDVVNRYDIDGVHLDDYFYPYPIKDAAGKLVPFPDDASWGRYSRGGGKMSRDDWRRYNVDSFIYRLYAGIKKSKPWVKFGISPFGIWRPGYPAGIEGMDQYSSLYADARKWLVNGWVDYFSPQLYWRIEPPKQSFPVLLKWWQEQNPKGRHLWPGLNTTKVGTEKDWSAEEIPNQIRLVRTQPGTDGHIHYEIKTISKNPKNLSAELAKVYAEPALVPASPWLSKVVPARPDITVRDIAGGKKMSWRSPGAEKVDLWVIQKGTGNNWKTQIVPANKLSEELKGTLPDFFAVTAVSRYGNASAPAVQQLR